MIGVLWLMFSYSLDNRLDTGDWVLAILLALIFSK